MNTQMSLLLNGMNVWGLKFSCHLRGAESFGHFLGDFLNVPANI